MLRRPFLALTLSLLPLSAFAADPALARYYRNTDFPGPDAYIVDVAISSAGQLVVKRCPPGGAADSACQIATATVAEAQLDAITAAADASGLAASPALQDIDIIPTGTIIGGGVWLNGSYLNLPSVLSTTDDAERVRPVLDAIEAAIPQDLRDTMF